jgi:hypothetical protein
VPTIGADGGHGAKSAFAHPTSYENLDANQFSSMRLLQTYDAVNTRILIDREGPEP